MANRLLLRPSTGTLGQRSALDVAKGLLVWVLAAAATGVIGDAASGLVLPQPSITQTTTQNQNADSPTKAASDASPARFDLRYGSYNDPSAVFTRTPPLPPPLDYEEKLKWVRDNGGVLEGTTVAVLAIAAPDAIEAPVYVDGIRVRTVKCADAVEGIYIPGIGAGDVFERVLDYDLDRTAVPQPRRYNMMQNDKPWRFPLWINSTESEVVTILLSAYSGSYEVEIDVTYRYKAKQYTETFKTSSNGDPLTVTGKRNGTSTVYVSPMAESFTEVERGETDGIPEWAARDPYKWVAVPGQAQQGPPAATLC